MLEQIFWLLVVSLVYPLIWIGGRSQSKLRTLLTNFWVWMWVSYWFLLPFTNRPRIGGIFVTPLAITGAILAIFGSSFMLIAMKRLGRAVFWGNAPAELVTDGVYGFVRHPIYTGEILYVIGWYLLWGSVYALYLYPILPTALWIQSHLEEKRLLERFGDEFKKHKEKVPMLFTSALMLIWVALLAVIVISVYFGLITLW